MSRFWTLLRSSLGIKFISGFTGVLLFLFIIIHLLGNLTLMAGPSVFNAYAHFLESLLHGWFVYAAEAGLVAVFILHIIAGIAVTWDKWKARPDGYVKAASAGGQSKKTISSRTMIYSGLILLVFLPIHIAMFKFGPREMTPGPERMRDLFVLVQRDLSQPGAALAYAFVMVVLGFHLRHGVWSQFQSLGLNNVVWLPILYRCALVAALLLGGGFLMLPVYFYFIH